VHYCIEFLLSSLIGSQKGILESGILYFFFGHRMNKLWIFKVLRICVSKSMVDSHEIVGVHFRQEYVMINFRKQSKSGVVTSSYIKSNSHQVRCRRVRFKVQIKSFLYKFGTCHLVVDIRWCRPLRIQCRYSNFTHLCWIKPSCTIFTTPISEWLLVLEHSHYTYKQNW